MKFQYMVYKNNVIRIEWQKCDTSNTHIFRIETAEGKKVQNVWRH